MRFDFIFDHVRVLFARSKWRQNDIFHINFNHTDRVFLGVNRFGSTNLIGHSFVWKVFCSSLFSNFYIFIFFRYLLFTMILISLSIIISVINVNIHRRRSSTHQMPNWARYVSDCDCDFILFLSNFFSKFFKVFLGILPHFLCMRRPKPDLPIEVQSARATRKMQWDLHEKHLPSPFIYGTKTKNIIMHL